MAPRRPLLCARLAAVALLALCARAEEGLSEAQLDALDAAAALELAAEPRNAAAPAAAAAAPAGKAKAGGAGGAPDAAKLLAAGDREFRAKAYDKAVRLYGESLAAAAALPAAPGADGKASPSAAARAKALYARHKAYIPLEKFERAIADLSGCVEIDAGNVLALLQRANLQLLTGACAEAVADYERVLQLDPAKRDANSRLPHARECAAALQRHAHWRAHSVWAQARDELTNAVADNRATHAPALLLQRAEAQLALGEVEAALGDLGRVLRWDASNLRAFALRGKALYQHGDFATARAHFQECLALDPEHAECKASYRQVKAVVKAREGGEQALQQGRWADAVQAYEAGLAADGATHVWLKEALPHLARAHWRRGAAFFDSAVAAARRAVTQVDDSLAEAHFVLAEVALAREEYEEAAREAKAAHERDRGSGEYQATMQRCEAALKQSKTKDYYKILGVPRNAGQAEIRKAYRRLALEWHPDKVEESRKEEAARRFSDIGEANEVLTDEEKKGKYDRGEEVFGPGAQQQQQHGGFPFPGGFPGGFHFRQG